MHPGIFSGDISLDEFLHSYWQKKPLVFRNAFPGFSSPITPEELAGLACEEGINSRLVKENTADNSWSVEYGPFDEEIFEQLPRTHWSLLVSDIEKHVPESQSILDQFKFIPEWRIDDLMISYAPSQGSVGPHTDAYDVFLLQASGKRKWMISQSYDTAILENSELRILKNFTAEETWILEPGDILYLPPDVAHHGIALEPCMTCSIGFRAPTVRAMISEYGEYIGNSIDEDLRYSDRDLKKQVHPAEISNDTLERISKILGSYYRTSNRDIVTWFGKYITDSRSSPDNYPEKEITLIKNISDQLDTIKTLSRSPFSRFAFFRENNQALLFIDGQCFETSIDFAEILCGGNIIDGKKLSSKIRSSSDRNAMQQIYNMGCLYIDDE